MRGREGRGEGKKVGGRKEGKKDGEEKGREGILNYINQKYVIS